jgi:hypothetical protein
MIIFILLVGCLRHMNCIIEENVFMKRMSLDKELINANYSSADVPDSVKNFRPVIYKDGEIYYVVLGADDAAIVGYGSDITAAMKEWDAAYWRKRYNKNDR